MVAPVIPIVLGGAQAGGLALTVMASAIRALYGMVVATNDYLNQHIEDMKGSENPTISRTGRVLEMAKLGFGIGYITSVVIIAAGQLLLGNTLAAIVTVATAATLTNPIAMTCAAFGAIYYGWGALSDLERNEMLDKLSKGLDVGIELIRSILRFVIDTMKELLSPQNIAEIKKFIGSAAAVFGKTLGDVTHKASDIVSDTFDVFKKTSGETFDKTVDVASGAYQTVADTAQKTVKGIKDRLDRPAAKGRKSLTKKEQ